MQTFIAIAIGLAVLAVFRIAGRRRPQWACFGFIAAWLALCVAHMTYAIRVAPFGASEELAAHAVAFGLPAALAFLMGLWAAGRQA